MESHAKTLMFYRGYKTHLPELSAMHHTVLHLSHCLSHSIGCQSSNVLSTNSLPLHTKHSYTSSHPTSFNISININLQGCCAHHTLCSLTFHQPKLSPLLVRSVFPLQLSGTICHLPSGSLPHYVYFCVCSKDTCFNASSVDLGYIRRLCIIVFIDIELRRRHINPRID